MDEVAAPLPPDEDLYRQSLASLRAPAKLPATSLLFVILLLVFAASSFGAMRSFSGVVLLVAVITVHEAGHALGMRAFGFRDVKMFFIPFFGAAVSGRARGALAWKEAAVTLLGPLPGILAGFALLLYGMSTPHPVALEFQAASVLLLLNGFNLLPFGFLDGGRFLGRVLFSRHRVLEVAFQAIGCVLLGILAIRGSMLGLGVVALISLAGLPRRWRILTAAATLKRAWPALPRDPDTLGETEGRALFAAARDTLQPPVNGSPAHVAQAMEAILDAAKPAPGAVGTLVMLSLYAFGLVVAVIGTSLAFSQTGSEDWQAASHAGWRAEFPRAPMELHTPASPRGPADTQWRAVVNGAERYTIQVASADADTAWMRASGERLAKASGTRITASRRIEIAGHPGLELELSDPHRAVRTRMVETGGRRFNVVASAPRWSRSQQRFLDSFTLTEGQP